MSEASPRLWPASLRTRWLGRVHREARRVESTSDLAWTWIAEREAAPHGAVVVAAQQTAGRGRQGRRWASPPGNLHVSIVLRPALPLADLLAWPLTVGLSLATSLEGDLRTPRVGLKWPNDLWLEGRKIGGILLESRAEPPVVVIGVGLNLVEPPGGWGELRGRALSLAGVGLRLEPAEVLAAWLPRLETDWESFVEEGFAPFRPGWASRSVLQGRRVRVEPGGDEVEVLGVDLAGALRVRGPDGLERALHAGEVHLGGGG